MYKYTCSTHVCLSFFLRSRRGEGDGGRDVDIRRARHENPPALRRRRHVALAPSAQVRRSTGGEKVREPGAHESWQKVSPCVARLP